MDSQITFATYLVLLVIVVSSFVDEMELAAAEKHALLESASFTYIEGVEEPGGGAAHNAVAPKARIPKHVINCGDYGNIEVL
ncbi:MAG: hypothetical protein LBU32_29075 [Clostridiales bacterium]|jgi:hypothetical protein|nr:hypothetical protein [Clostridiales bacterium]